MGQIGVVQKTNVLPAVGSGPVCRRADLPRLTIPLTPSLNRRHNEGDTDYRILSPVGSSSSSSSDAAEVERVLGCITPEIVVSASPCRSDASDDVLPVTTKIMLSDLKNSRKSKPRSPCSPTPSSSTAPPSPALSDVPSVTLPDWKENQIWTPEWLRMHRLGPDGLRPSKRRRLSKAALVLLCNDKGEYDVAFSKPSTPVNSTFSQLATDDTVAASERLAEAFRQLANDAQRELLCEDPYTTDDGSRLMDYTEPLYPAAAYPCPSQGADAVNGDFTGCATPQVVTPTPSSPESPSFGSLDLTSAYGEMPMSSTPVKAGTQATLHFLEEPTVAAIDFGVGEEVSCESSSIPVDPASESILGQSLECDFDDRGRHLAPPDSLDDVPDFEARQSEVVENVTDGGLSSLPSLPLIECLPPLGFNIKAHSVATKSFVVREDARGSPSRSYETGNLSSNDGSNAHHQPIPPTISEQSPSSDESYDLNDHLPPISPSSSCDLEELRGDGAYSDSEALWSPVEEDDSFELDTDNLWGERLMDQTFEDEMQGCDDYDFNFDPVSMSSSAVKQGSEHAPSVDVESVNSVYERIGNCSSTASVTSPLSPVLSTFPASPSPVTQNLLFYDKPQMMSSVDSNECIGHSLSTILEEEEPDSSEDLTSSTSLDIAVGKVDSMTKPIARQFMREATPALMSDTSSFTSPMSVLATPDSNGRGRFLHEHDSSPTKIPLPPLEYLKQEFNSLLSEELPPPSRLCEPIEPLLESDLLCPPNPRDEEVFSRIVQPPPDPVLA
ncbi:hypothetical protein BD410DRAFT_9520 [Rickenella mellea]|uniref:Uncharacterized protein n=1 Tax=Rickenella mellea TaxID=50990 RepID=A0A4R5XDT7_9AGAM|nr:hypothetical protein BD410DRAFT_9520 [Rickenella mellea]